MEEHLVQLAIKNYSPQSAITRRRLLTLFLRWAQERDLTAPGDVTKEILQEYQYDLWRARKANGMPLAVGTQIARLVAVRGFFRWLVRQGVLTVNPAGDLELPREGRRLPPDTLSFREVEAILGAPETGDPLGVRDRAILEVLYSSGIRRGEAASLELRDLNTERRALAIRHGKGNRDRFVPVGERALRWTRDYIENARPLLECDPGEQALFLTGYGRAFSPGSLGFLVRKYVERAGIQRRGSCHLLRHACATHMLEGGADIRVIQELLGHAKLETTFLYTEVSIILLREVHARTHPTAKG